MGDTEEELEADANELLTTFAPAGGDARRNRPSRARGGDPALRELGVMLGVLVFAPRIWRSRLARSRARMVATFVLMGWVVFVFGAHSHIGSQPQVATGVNPVPASAEAVEVGRQLYQQQCASCHGASGLGDGPQSANLRPPPADLRLHVPLHPDSQIYGFISGGFPGSAMPAFEGRLTDTQLWNLVHYLRSLTQTTTQ